MPDKSIGLIRVKSLVMDLLRNFAVFGWLAATCAASMGQLAEISGENYQFREPILQNYRIEPAMESMKSSTTGRAWIKAWPERAPRQPVLLGSRVVIKLAPGVSLEDTLQGSPLQWARSRGNGIHILQAPEAMLAIHEAQRIGALEGVEACYPIRKRQLARLGLYAERPNDPYYYYQWYFENRGEDGVSRGADINVRAAWPYATGQAIHVAVADDGIEFTHPELGPRNEPSIDFSFETWTTNAFPSGDDSNHGTAVAGLIAANGGNQLGMIGTAYQAMISSWVIFGKDGYAIDDERMADMFEYASDRVDIQNHSWGNASDYQLDPSMLERIAISNTVAMGRSGKGTVLVRAAGNRRQDWGNANDDGYASSPLAIAVAAVRSDGRTTSYSCPGACVLVAAPSGDQANSFPTIFTTDRQGANGYNRVSFTNDFADYAFNEAGFSGTSAAAPLISGIAALILSANTHLSYRDLQQILILSARHCDTNDPDLIANGAGLMVSHNTGFGIPDAGTAVSLACSWPNRPPLARIAFTNSESRPIPDDGLRVRVLDPLAPASLQAVRCLPSFGPHADRPTAALPLVFVGLATNTIIADPPPAASGTAGVVIVPGHISGSKSLQGKAALIERGVSFFEDKIRFAAEAGAAYAVIYNNREGDAMVFMDGTQFSPIPAVFIGQNDGIALRDYITANTNALVRIQLDSCVYRFHVSNSLQCEHVGVRIRTDHHRRGDLRITLTSPSGTCSILQHLNLDETAGPVDWTYYSTHHFFESSQGTWTVAVGDEQKNTAGQVLSVQLLIHGAAITDTDSDGLDDSWEQNFFGHLLQRSADDPDQDGLSNLRELLLRSNPAINENNLELSLFRWTTNMVRLSWPAAAARSYEILAAPDTGTPWSVATNVAGAFPEAVWFAPYTEMPSRLMRVRSIPLE